MQKLSIVMLTDETKYQQRIAQLEREVADLKAKLTAKQKATRYGLVWEDVPEAFEQEAENKIPILEEVKDKAIKNDDGKPTHILIEGDNYHALQCLNYTHRDKVDVIYIDPPYNTGSDGFTYKDKRFLDEFPNGSIIPKEHPLRHSTWLSFMSKRLELAKNLLSERGVIFISIDDNEQANCKLLCDKVFGEDNFIVSFPRITKRSGKSSDVIAKNHDYVIAYSKTNSYTLNPLEHNDSNFKHKDEYFEERGYYKLNQTLDYDSLQYSASLDYPLEYEGETFYPGTSKINYEKRKTGNYKRADWAWRWSKEKFQFGKDNGFIVLKQSKNGKRIYTKTYQNATIEDDISGYKVVIKQRTTAVSTLNLCENEYSNDNATKDLTEIFGEKLFDYSKPIALIQHLTFIATQKNSIILDFFAGSGTTLHATMKLNAEDGGNRQCILVQQKEGDKNICESVTYERNKRVINGYTNAKGEIVEGLGNSLKYYRTAFVGNHDAATATDEDKVVLAHKAGCLIAIAENTLDEVVANNTFQIFQDGTRYTAVYFSGNLGDMPEFTEKLESLRDSSRLIKIEAYIYCLGNVQQFENEFNSLRRINLHAIPQPIIEIYKQLNA